MISQPFATPLYIPNFLSGIQLQNLQDDIRLLKAMGIGNTAGIATRKHSQSVRQNVNQIWLHTPTSGTENILFGSWGVRNELIQTMHGIRENLNRDLPRELMELSYLWYEPGAFYKRHVDTFTDPNSSRIYRRSISLILFLGDPTSNRPWDVDCDGGALRVFSGDDLGESYEDFSPEPGALLLFDSATVPHQVLETHRTRACIVGWFNTLN